MDILIPGIDDLTIYHSVGEWHFFIVKCRLMIDYHIKVLQLQEKNNGIGGDC